MIFSDQKSKTTHHNKLNLRDKSTDPSNLHGDRDLYVQENADLNDRAEEDDSDDGPPPLETAYVSPDARRRKVLEKKRKP